MTDATLAMMEHWQDTREPLDIPLEMTRLAQRIGGLTLFNMDLGSEIDTVGHTVTELLPLLAKYGVMPFPPINVPTRRNRRIQAGMRTLDEVVYGIIAARRADPTSVETNDLLSMLLWARDEETGEGMSDQQLRDEVMNLLIAGHETSTVALTWIWYVLSQYPEVESRLHAELDAVLGGRPPTFEQLANLPYTKMVVQETLRLYPPIFVMGRHAITDDNVGGYHVPANGVALLSPYCTHRHPEFWERPEVFDPERFSPERSANRPRFAYFPFGGGPRQCIGNSFALMEAQLVLATVAQRYRLRLVPSHPVEPQATVIVQPRYGLPMTLHPR
jgi:cytochrome P450